MLSSMEGEMKNFSDNPTPVHCGGCGGIATAKPEAASDCTCEFGSCSLDGCPYATAEQLRARCCAVCENRHEAQAMENRITQDLPALTEDDFHAELMRRVGAEPADYSALGMTPPTGRAA